MKKRRNREQKLPNSALPLLRYLEAYGSKTQRELIEELDLPVRTVRYSIRRLLEKNLIQKQPNLADMRSVYYSINRNIVLDIEEVIQKELSIIES